MVKDEGLVWLFLCQTAQNTFDFYPYIWIVADFVESLKLV